MDVVFTDTSGHDLGVLREAEIDITYGNKGNDFELKLPVESDQSIPIGGFVYLEGTEYGGIVDEEGADRTSKRPVKLYRGRTWHGILAGKTLYREDGSDIVLAGDAHAVIQAIVSLAGLEDIFAASADPNPTTQRLVRFAEPPRPRVTLAADSSSPILTMLAIKGTSRYSTMATGPFFQLTPRNCMASRMERYSSATVGKKRKMTANGMITFSVSLSRVKAATNSLTFVLASR